MRKQLIALLGATPFSVLAAACGVVEPEPTRTGGPFEDGNDIGASSSGSESGSGSSSGAGGSGSSGTSAGGQLRPGDQMWTIEAAGRSRTVRVHVPVSVVGRSLPAVIAFHGNGDKAQSFDDATGLRARADESAFILFTPDGLERDIPVAGGIAPNVSWDAYNLYENNWDLQLLTALRKRLQATGSAATTKVSLYGFSQGGYFAYRAAQALSSDFSCSAVLGASDPSDHAVAFTRPIPITLMIGTSDYGIDRARATDQALTTAGHPHEYVEIPGLGHALAPAPKRFEPLDYCLGQSL